MANPESGPEFNRESRGDHRGQTPDTNRSVTSGAGVLKT